MTPNGSGAGRYLILLGSVGAGRRHRSAGRLEGLQVPAALEKGGGRGRGEFSKGFWKAHLGLLKKEALIQLIQVDQEKNLEQRKRNTYKLKEMILLMDKILHHLTTLPWKGRIATPAPPHSMLARPL